MVVIGRIVLGILVVAVAVFLALRIPAIVGSGSTVTQLASGAPLQQIRTTSDIYLGKIVGADDGYLRIAGAAIVREQPQASGAPAQIFVIRLTNDPFNIDGDLLVERSNVVFVGNVGRDSGLERAYRQAIGDLPLPSPAASTAP